MKKISLRLIPFFVVILISWHPLLGQDLTPRPGMDLSYAFSTNRSQSTLDIKVTRFDEAGLAFTYAISDPGFTGSIAFPKSALEKGHHHAFPLMKGDRTFDDRTSMWLSGELVNEVQKGHAHRETTCCAAEWELIGKESISILLNGEETDLKVLHLKDDTRSEYWVLDDPENPLIIKAVKGWEMVLTSLEMP